MTACWSKGYGGSYPYYLCFGKGCVEYRKSISREKVEGAFESLLQRIKPSRDACAIIEDMSRKMWDLHSQGREQERLSLDAQIKQTQKAIDQLLDHILAAKNPTVIKAYENKLNELEQQKIVLGEKKQNCGSVLPDFDETFRTALKFAASPHELWVSGSLVERLLVPRLVFTDKLQYDRKQGFRTVPIAQPFLLLGQLGDGQYDLARRKGKSFNQELRKTLDILAEWNMALRDSSLDRSDPEIETGVAAPSL